MKKSKVVITVIIGTIIIAYLFHNNKKSEEFKTTDFTYYEFFDTIIKVRIYDKVDDDIETKIEARLSELHLVSNNFPNEENSIYNLNKSGIMNNTDDINTMITDSVKVYNEVSNQFNIALGPVVNVWKNYMSECNDNNVCNVPSENELTFDENLLDPNNISITNDQVSIVDGMSIDLGGVAKGYAADQISKVLKSEGYKHYIIDAGGNILVTSKPNGDDFSIGIVDPKDTSNIFTTLNIKNKAVVTSGDYERYYEIDGVRYHHIINDETHYPSTYFRSVTIITNESMYADMYSTLFFNNSLNDGKQIVSSLNDVEIIWYGENGNTSETKGVNQYEKN